MGAQDIPGGGCCSPSLRSLLPVRQGRVWSWHMADPRAGFPDKERPGWRCLAGNTWPQDCAGGGEESLRAQGGALNRRRAEGSLRGHEGAACGHHPRPDLGSQGLECRQRWWRRRSQRAWEPGEDPVTRCESQGVPSGAAREGLGGHLRTRQGPWLPRRQRNRPGSGWVRGGRST